MKKKRKETLYQDAVYLLSRLIPPFPDIPPTLAPVILLSRYSLTQTIPDNPPPTFRYFPHEVFIPSLRLVLTQSDIFLRIFHVTTKLRITQLKYSPEIHAVIFLHLISVIHLISPASIIYIL